LQFPIFIARRFLARQKGTFSAFIIRLAIIATALGVAVMVISLALISGFKFAIREKLFSFWGQVLVVPYDAQGSDIVATNPIVYDPNLLKQIATTPHVTQVAPFALKPGIIHANEEIEGIRLKGVTPEFRFNKGLAFSGKGIRFQDTGYAKSIILSQTTAARLNLKIGDDLLLYAIDPGSTAPRIRKLEVTGFFHTGMEEVDKQFAICDLRLIQRLSNWDSNQISGYQVELDNTSLADTMANLIYDQYIQPPMESYSITHVYEGIFSWLNMQDVNARILLIIVGIMAVINLSAALLILMVDRSVTIGMLKALGMPDAGLQYIFIYLAGLIGLWGLFLGNVLGLGLCLLQQHFGFLHLPEDTYYMETVPVRIIWWHVLMIDAGTLLLCLLCMTLPTLYIRRIQTARVLQFK
jgi:lipoprotein-releasing system permease protein